jgi:serine/threonine-protein kinase
MQAGTQLGAYRIVREIGRGGMGTVWLAEHTMLGRRAAIKVLHPIYSSDPVIVARFFNEARAATAISDPGIVQIFDFGNHVDGSAYIVMELLEGETLADRLKRFTALSVADALRIMRQVATSLGAAHRAGIVHRDLKPENIFIVADPEAAGGERPRIVDFGIAKLEASSAVKTQTSAVLGPPAYMSPEQCRGAGHVDQRSDVYAFGCVLFALLAGHPPFESEGMGEVIAMHLREPAPRLSSRAPHVPPEVDQLVDMCLAKDPARRPASGTELAAIMGRLAGSVPAVGRVATPWPVATAALPRTAPMSTTLSAANGVSRVVARPRRSRTLVFAAVGLAVGGAAVVALWPNAAPTAPAQEPVPAPPAVAQTAPPPRAVTETAPAAVAANPEPAKSTPEADTAARIKDVLSRFESWANAHPGASCPDVEALGGSGDDAWGHRIVLTCTDQPADQRIGAISLGPDGVRGTDDDIASWQLGRDVTALVKGKRKTPATPARVKRTNRAGRPAPTSSDDIPSDR